MATRFDGVPWMFVVLLSIVAVASALTALVNGSKQMSAFGLASIATMRGWERNKDD